MLIKEERFPLRSLLTIGLLPSWLKICVYRLRGAKIGCNVHIGFGSVIIAKKIEIGDNTHIGFGAVLRAREVTIKNNVKIGSLVFFDVEKIFIDEDAKINELVFAGGLMLPESYLHIGKRTIVMQLTFLNPTKPLIIGDDSGIGGTCLLFTHGVWQSQLDGYPVSYAPITLGRNVWLPWHVFVLPGVTIGDGATVGGGSLVNKDVPANTLVAGIPIKVLKTADQYPVEPNTEEKVRMVSEMLAEFVRFMEYHGFSVERKEQKGWETICFNKTESAFLRKKRFRAAIFYRANATSRTSQLDLSKQNVCLSLVSYNRDELIHIESAKGMWIDLEAQTRGGTSSDLGEELVMFLSRYGLRFARR